jgi:hypothetical protein
MLTALRALAQDRRSTRSALVRQRLSGLIYCAAVLVTFTQSSGYRRLCPTMPDDLQLLHDVTLHDPILVMGVLLIATSAILFAYIKLKLRDAGYGVSLWSRSTFDWVLPFNYLKARSKNGWSPWPAYLFPLTLLLGILGLIAGLFHLPN